jgi:hypothetical protein
MAMRDRRQPRPGTLTIRPLQDRAGLILAGEADLTARDTLHAALAALPADGTGDIHLDLTGLRFIDVACTRELIALTGRHPAARLIAHHPPASLLRITALLYPDATMEFTGTSRPLGPPPAARTRPRPPPPVTAAAACRTAPRCPAQTAGRHDGS